MMKLYAEMKSTMIEIMEAEEAAKGWAKEARAKRDDLKAIYRTAKKIDPEHATYEFPEIEAILRGEIEKEQEEATLAPSDPDNYLNREVATADPTEENNA